MRVFWILTVLLATAPLTSASTPGDVTGDGVTDAEDLTCVNATIYDEDAGCAVESASYVRTVVVSPVPGDASASGAALLAAVAAIDDASETNPYLVKLEPGVYDIGTGQLITKSWVNIEGAGEDVTRIRSAGSNLTTVQLAPNCEIRLLTIAHDGGSLFSVGLETLPGDTGDPRTLWHVRIEVLPGSSQSTGVWAPNEITMRNCSVEVEGTASALGVYLEEISLLQDTSILVKDATTCKGVDINGSGWFVVLRNTEVTVHSGTDCTGVHFRIGGGTKILGSTVIASWCSDVNTAIKNESTLSLRIEDSFVYAYVSTVGSGTGLKNTGSEVTVTVINSTIGVEGDSYPLLAVDNDFTGGYERDIRVYNSMIVEDVVNENDTTDLFFASCQLSNTSISGTGTTRCIGCYDENFQNSAGWTSCPP